MVVSRYPTDDSTTVQTCSTLHILRQLQLQLQLQYGVNGYKREEYVAYQPVHEVVHTDVRLCNINSPRPSYNSLVQPVGAQFP